MIEDIDKFIKAFCKLKKIKLKDIKKKNEDRTVVEYKHICIYLILSYSKGWVRLTQVGKCFGNLGHSTVYKANKRISDRIEASPRFEKQVNNIKELLITN